MKESPKRTIEDREADYARDGIRYSLEGAVKNMTPRKTTRKMTSLERIAAKLRHRLKSLSGPNKMLSEAEEVQLIARTLLSERSKARRELVKKLTDHMESCEREARHGGNTEGAERWAATTRMILSLSHPGRGRK